MKQSLQLMVAVKKFFHLVVAVEKFFFCFPCEDSGDNERDSGGGVNNIENKAIVARDADHGQDCVGEVRHFL